MCKLYAVRKSRDELRGLFLVSHNRATGINVMGLLPLLAQMEVPPECLVASPDWSGRRRVVTRSAMSL
jgi:hypothetical protein